MPQLHIANTFFERELTDSKPLPLKAGFHSHPLFLQLQYLPFLYGRPEESVLVTHAPSQEFLEKLQKQGIHGPTRWFTYSDKIPPIEISCWGKSRSIADWAAEKRLSYPVPSWELIEEVNSKTFSFLCGKKLPHAQLLHQQSELDAWVMSFAGPKVLKTCFGLSGRGHFHLSAENSAQARAFAAAEWRQGRPVLAEPWVKRLLDFSTQWHVEKERLDYLGATICENDAFGRYRATQVGDEREIFGSYLHFLDEHKIHAERVLASIAEKGFFGNLGIDAMVYEDLGAPLLQPIVEINARKTMGWVALEIARLHFPAHILRIALKNGDSSSCSLLPHAVDHHQFSKHLNLELKEKSLSR